MNDQGIEIRTFDSIKVGEKASSERILEEQSILAFAELSGDKNSLHIDENYAETSGFGQRVVHGLFLGSLLSGVIGMKLPGKYSLLLTESLEFKKPAMFEDKVRASVTVINKSEATRIVELLLEIHRGEELLATGNAKVKVLE